MARLGLGSGWTCLLANDFDKKKVKTYSDNFGNKEVRCDDIYNLGSSDFPSAATLAWASFPCQDLSLAGSGRGLSGERSGTFWGFWSAIHNLKIEGRSPAVLVLENVCGALSSNGGKDFIEICHGLSALGYRFGGVVVDAINFLPQSRPRLFVVCIQESAFSTVANIATKPIKRWHSAVMQKVVAELPSHLAVKWIWWNLPQPPTRTVLLENILDFEETGHVWHSVEETSRILAMMSEVNRLKVEAAQRSRTRIAGTLYKRTRIENGVRMQRAEVRFDGVAGCLRTPNGGSSRQTVILIEGDSIKTRLLSIREAARLMGVSDNYILPHNYNDGYHVFGDGLAVPVVAFLRKHLLEPIVESSKAITSFSVAAE